MWKGIYDNEENEGLSQQLNTEQISAAKDGTAAPLFVRILICKQALKNSRARKVPRDASGRRRCDVGHEVGHRYVGTARLQLWTIDRSAP